MEPEKDAKIALGVMKHVASNQRAEYNDYQRNIHNLFMDVLENHFESKDLSPPMASLAVAETVTSILSAVLVMTAESLMNYPAVTREDKAYGDLFRRAVIDYLLEGTNEALHGGAMDSLLRLGKKEG